MAGLPTGKGGVVAVTATSQLIAIVPAAGVDGHYASALTLRVSNEGAQTCYALVNAEITDYANDAAIVATAIPIAPDKDFWFVGQPIKKLILVCDTGESTTANYGAY